VRALACAAMRYTVACFIGLHLAASILAQELH